jgi:hypothetical protein
MANRTDFSWSAALDENDGLLARSFVQEFNPDAVAEAPNYAAMASRVYRECSEFMHGKHQSTRMLPETLSFSETALSQWCAAAIGCAESVLFLLHCRYTDELMDDFADTISQPLENSLSHLLSVRRRLGLPVEQEDYH